MTVHPCECTQSRPSETNDTTVVYTYSIRGVWTVQLCAADETAQMEASMTNRRITPPGKPILADCILAVYCIYNRRPLRHCIRQRYTSSAYVIPTDPQTDPSQVERPCCHWHHPWQVVVVGGLPQAQQESAQQPVS